MLHRLELSRSGPLHCGLGVRRRGARAGRGGRHGQRATMPEGRRSSSRASASRSTAAGFTWDCDAHLFTAGPSRTTSCSATRAGRASASPTPCSAPPRRTASPRALIRRGAALHHGTWLHWPSSPRRVGTADRLQPSSQSHPRWRGGDAARAQGRSTARDRHRGSPPPRRGVLVTAVATLLTGGRRARRRRRA